MSVFFTSDLHFHHLNVIKFCNRPYKNVDEMNEKLIKNWNSRVTNKDEIYCLGDFSWKCSQEQLKEILNQLKGKKHLILGNHDKAKLHIKTQLWESVENYKRIIINDKRVVLCHYPIFDFDCAYHKSVHLFGHIHKQSDVDEIYQFHQRKGFYSYCVGVVFNNWMPVCFDEILEKINYERS